MKKYKWISAVWALSLLFFACEPQELDDYDLGTKPMETEVTFTTTPQADRPNVVTFHNTSNATGIAVWDLAMAPKQGQSGNWRISFAAIIPLLWCCTQKPVPLPKLSP